MKQAAVDRMQAVADAFGEADPERVAAQEKFMSELLNNHDG
jgi:hypothetical protein